MTDDADLVKRGDDPALDAVVDILNRMLIAGASLVSAQFRGARVISIEGQFGKVEDKPTSDLQLHKATMPKGDDTLHPAPTSDRAN